MTKQSLKTFSNIKTKNVLTEKQKASILHDIEIINFIRIKILLIILLIIEILFIMLSDIPYLKNMNIDLTWNDKRYFIFHLLNLIVSIFGIIIINILMANDKGELNKSYKIITPTLTTIILVSMSVVSGLDQLKIGNSSSIFIANLFICCALILMKLSTAFITYSIPFSSYIICLIIFQKNSALLISNIINGSIFFIAVIFISKYIYDSQFNLMTEKTLLDESNKKLNYLSSHDPLTGLSNRRNFEIHAKQVIESSNEKSVIILIDIDHFKNINDTFGHPMGDAVLKEISNILLKYIKNADLATRWGGEEFLILIPETSIDEAYALTNKIRESIEKIVLNIDNFKIKVTASFGMSQLTGSFSTSFDVSYKLADNALYEAKKKGRNQVVIASFTKE